MYVAAGWKVCLGLVGKGLKFGSCVLGKLPNTFSGLLSLLNFIGYLLSFEVASYI